MVHPGKKVTIKQRDEEDVVTRITQVALGPKPKQGASVVTIETGGKSVVIGTLNRDGETSFGVRLGRRGTVFPEQGSHLRARHIHSGVGETGAFNQSPAASRNATWLTLRRS